MDNQPLQVEEEKLYQKRYMREAEGVVPNNGSYQGNPSSRSEHASVIIHIRPVEGYQVVQNNGSSKINLTFYFRTINDNKWNAQSSYTHQAGTL